jgi:predicted O-methyltransferase YrrM
VIFPKRTRLLSQLVHEASRILEFGSGGSTQIFAHYSRPEAEVISIETHEFWIRRTQQNLERLGIRKPVQFVHWNVQENPLKNLQGPFDLVFIDGIDPLRADFYRMAWEKTGIGSIIASHDTRRPQDFKSSSNSSRPIGLKSSRCK